MFLALGKAVSRGWPAFLAIWVVLFAGTYIAAPKWELVAIDREFELMPSEMPSRRGEDLFKRAFPDDPLTSSAVIVLSREDEVGLLEEDVEFIEDVLRPRLDEIAQEDGTDSIIAGVRSLGDEGVGALLVSQDNKASLVVVELTTEFLERRNWATIEKIENVIEELRPSHLPSGLQVALTGDAVVGRDTTRAQVLSAKDTEFWTVVLVIALLIIIYRAPLIALIPLLTVFFAVQISIKLLSLLAQAELIALFEGIQIFITVLVYGAGVDYCLFLTARYKEELDGGATPRDAVAGAIGKVGTALLASAGTVICGIGMMVFADFGKFHQAGVAIPIGLAIVLLGALTLTPSLLRLTGRWAFWPRSVQPFSGASPATEDRPVRRDIFDPMWEKVGQALLRRPGLIWLASMAAMLPFALVAIRHYNNLNFDLLNKLSPDAPSVIGTRVLQRHFPAGATGPITVLIRHDEIDFRDAENDALIGQLTQRLSERSDEMAVSDIRTLTEPLGMSEAAKAAVGGVVAPPELMSASQASDEMQEPIRNPVRERALTYYVAGGAELAGHVTRLVLTLNDNPFSRRSTTRLDEIERAVRAELPDKLRRSQLALIGPTPSIRDLETVTSRDQKRIEILVVVSVLAILLVLLRTLAISVYLILSVLVSFLATLGLTVTLFWLLDPHGFEGLDWKVPIFLFTILIAVGEDYNIFLMTRIREEQKRHGPVHGITVALAKTGGIISSCGIIMAGTFSSLVSGSLAGMQQLGFALAFGVLVDTFIVRPILVPAFLILLEKAKSHFGKGWKAEQPVSESRART